MRNKFFEMVYKVLKTKQIQASCEFMSEERMDALERQIHQIAFSLNAAFDAVANVLGEISENYGSLINEGYTDQEIEAVLHRIVRRRFNYRVYRDLKGL